VSVSHVFGEALHGAIQIYFENLLARRIPSTLESLMYRYHQVFQRHERSQIEYGMDDRAALELLASRMLAGFLKHPVTQKPGRILAVSHEVRGTLPPGLLPWVGQVDVIAESGEEIILREWRVSRTSLTQEQITDAWHPLALAADSLPQFTSGREVRLELIVLTKTKDLAIERHSQLLSQGLVERGRRIVERVGQAVKAGLFYPAPSPINCSTCPFRDACRAWPG
jgi:hypothetical protein